jgi:acetyl esterase/lipase
LGKVQLFVIAVCLTLTACTPIQLLNAVTSDRSYRLVEGLAYGPNTRHRLDLAVPEDGPVKGLVLFFYGGGWVDGDRQDFHFVIESFARDGYAVALPDYRLYPEVRFPGFVQDGAQAMAWVMANAGDYGVPNQPLILAGHSAGAHIAAMLTFDERFRQAAGLSEDPISAFVGLSGPYDFLPLNSATLEAVFAPPQQYPASQPVNFVDGDEAPSLLIHGDGDETAWPRNSRRLAARIREQGGVVETHYYPGVGHARVILALSPTFKRAAPVASTTLEFLARYAPATGNPTAMVLGE